MKLIRVYVFFYLSRPLRPIEEVYQPVPDNMKPPVETILQSIREHLPGSVFLHAWEDQPKETPFVTPPLTVTTPLEFMEEFTKDHKCQTKCDCPQVFLDELTWSEEERKRTEKETRGQHKNKNWHTMRTGLVTASKVKTICHSTNYRRLGCSFRRRP